MRWCSNAFPHSPTQGDALFLNLGKSEFFKTAIWRLSSLLPLATVSTLAVRLHWFLYRSHQSWWVGSLYRISSKCTTTLKQMHIPPALNSILSYLLLFVNPNYETHYKKHQQHKNLPVGCQCLVANIKLSQCEHKLSLAQNLFILLPCCP